MVDLVIAIVGKTCSGKDTLAKYICDKYNLDFVISYTTREMRISDKDGENHYFISDDEMDELEQKSLLSYTKNDETGIRYCALQEDVTSNYAVYILNPEAIFWTLNNTSVKVVSIYLNVPEGVLKRRALQRGDNPDVVLKRLDSEREEFDSFVTNKQYDYFIDGTQSFKLIRNEIDKVMEVINDNF